MAYELRDYAGGAEATTLAADITSSSLSITIASSTGWPSGGANGPFHIVINRGESTEEKIEVESRTGTTLTVASTSERGVDGTTATAHTTGATVEHCHTAQDAQEANSHITDTALDHHCFTDDVELLTTEGWVGSEALVPGMVAVTFDLDTERAVPEPIAQVFRYPAAEFPEVVEFTSQDFGRLRVTPDHTMVWRRRGNNAAPSYRWGTRKARTMPKVFSLPAWGAGHDRELPVSDDALRVIAWTATEGHLHANTYSVAQKDGPCADRIRDALDRLGSEYSEYKQRGDMRVFRIPRSGLTYWLDDEKVPRRSLLAMSARQARLFIGELVLGDGHVPGGDKLNRIDSWLAGGPQPSMILASINHRFLDWVQELCVTNGIKSRCYTDGLGVGRLSIKSSREHTGLTRETVPNDRNVWCVSVPEHRTLIVRAPGSTPVVTGNTQYLNESRHDTTTRHTVGTVVPAGTPGTIQPDDSAAAGAANSVARSDHTHAITCAAPGAVAIDDVAAEGVATSFARSDHTHGVSAGTPGTIEPDDAADEGVATTFARSDHTHAVGAASPSALDAASTNTEGVATSFSRSDHVHSMENLPWGVVGTPFESETDSANYTSSTTTDMSTTFTADTTRRYRINLHTPWSLSTSGRWLLTFSDGSAIHRCGDISYDSEGASDVLDASALWEPAVGGSTTIDVNLSEISGSSTFKFVAGSGFPRQLWVEDVGPR